MAGRKKARTSQAPKKEPSPAEKRGYLSQADVPGSGLEEALRIPRALAEHYACKPTTPLNVAASIEMAPGGGQFKRLSGAALAYGLVTGGAQSTEIGLTDLGLRIVRPTLEGDDLAAKREALLKPRVLGEFLRRYDGSPLPREDIARNVLIEMSVPHDRAADVRELIIESADAVGILKVIKGKQYIDLSNVAVAQGKESESDDDSSHDQDEDGVADDLVKPAVASTSAKVSQRENPAAVDQAARRVFVSHGKNRGFLDTIKKLLGFGEMVAVVSVERISVSQPVPDKVMGEMRSCGAAIIHVDAEQTLLDKEANEHAVLNPNVLIEIGAAMALYGRRFILLVRAGVKVPSNLQGLFEVRYTGDTLDGDATIRLLEAINDIKNHAMPDRYSSSDKGPAN